MLHRRRIFFYLASIFILSFISGIILLNSLLDIFPSLKIQLTEQIKSKIALIGSAENVNVNIHYGQPTLELHGVKLKRNQYLSGKVEHVRLTVSLLKSLWYWQPRITLIKVDSGKLSILKPKVQQIENKASRLPEVAAPNNIKIKLSNIEVEYDSKKAPLKINKFLYKGSSTKLLEAKLQFEGKPINIKTELTGDILDWHQWSGFSYIELESFKTDYLKPYVSVGELPKAVSGEFWLTFEPGKLTEIQSLFRVDEFKTKFGQFNNIKGRGLVEQKEKGYRLVLQDLNYKYQKNYYHQNHIELEAAANYEIEKINVSGLDYKAVKPFISKVSIPSNFPKIQSGYFNLIKIEKVKDKWQADLDFKDLTLQQKDMQFSQLSGQIFYADHEFTIKLDSNNSELLVKKNKVELEHLLVNVRAEEKKGHWKVIGRQNSLTLHQTNLRFDFEYSELLNKPLLKILFEGEIKAPNQFVLEINQLGFSNNLKRWLKEAFDDKGQFNVQGLYRGPLTHVDFGKNAVMQVNADIKNVNLNYKTGWPIAYGAKGHLRVRNQALSASIEHAELSHEKIKNIQVDIPDLFENEQHVLVNGNIPIGLKNISSFIQQSPLKKVLSSLAKMEFLGEGELGLNIDIPLGKTPSSVKGYVNFEEAALNVPEWDLMFKQITSKIDFDESGFSTPHIEGILLGKPVHGRVTRDKKGSTLHLSGKGDYEHFLEFFRIEQIKDLLKGDFNYTAKLIMNKNEDTQLQVSYKPTKIIPTLDLPIVSDLVPERMVITIRNDAIQSVRLSQRRESFYLNRVKNKFFIVGKLMTLNMDDVIKLADKIKSGKAIETECQMDIAINKVIYRGKAFKKVNFGINHHNGNSTYSFKTKDLAGTLSVEPDHYHVDLSYLNISLNSDPSKPIQMNLPKKAIDLHVKSLTINNSYLGDVSLVADPEGNALVIKKGKIKQKDFTIKFKGNWNKHRTSIKGKIDAASVQPFLGIFNADDMMRSNKTQGSFDLSWPGAPWQMEEERLAGNIKIKMFNGFIPKLDESVEKKLGFAKLINLLSFSSLKRKLSLDFSDIGRHGLDFNTIDSSLYFENGLLRVSRLELDGNVLFVKVNGYLDLNKKTFNIQLHVNPYVTSSLPTIATIAGGPLAGFATWVANKAVNSVIQKKPFYLYNISGPWEEPIVKQVKRSVGKAK